MRAEPIWHAAQSSRFIYARCDLAAPANFRSGILQCSGSGPYEVFLGGRKVIRGLGGALTQVPVWQEFEIGPSPHSGGSTLMVFAGGHPHDDLSWFAAKGEITCEDGSILKVGTGPSWKVVEALAWRINPEAPISPVFFAAAEPGGELAEWIDAQIWEDAVVVEGLSIQAQWGPRPVHEIEVRPSEVGAFGETGAEGPLRFVREPGKMKSCKCVHREGLLSPGRRQTRVQTGNPQRAVYLLLDFGRLVHGFPRLRLRGTTDSRIDLGFSRTWGRIETSVRYVCTDDYREWTGIFPHTCRYMVLRLSNCPEAVELDCVSMLERKVSVQSRGTFSAGRARGINWEAGRRTLDICRQEIYSPSLGLGSYDWVGAYAFALNDYYLSGDCHTAAATLAGATVSRQDPLHSLAYLLFLEAYFHYSGDVERTADLLPDVRQILAAHEERGDGRGLLQLDGEGAATAVNALYAGALAAGSRLFHGLGRLDMAASCRHEYGRVRKALQQYWSEDQGLFVDGPGEDGISQWTNALVLYFGLAPGPQEQRIVRRIRAADVLRVDCMSQAFFVAGGLWQAGAGDRSITYIQQQWGRDGLTGTLRMEEKGKTGASGLAPGPEYFLGSKVLGVVPGKPGYEVVEVRPHPAGLDSATGCISTRRGNVEVQWQRTAEPARFTLGIRLSKAGETQICVPRLGLPFPTLSLNGETVWRNEKIHPNSFVQEISSEEDYVALKVRDAGRYEVAVE